MSILNIAHTIYSFMTTYNKVTAFNFLVWAYLSRWLFFHDLVICSYECNWMCMVYMYLDVFVAILY